MEHQTLPVVLAVGGSDPSAHAGLQVDLRVANDLAAHCVTVTSAVTAQNSQRLITIQAVDTDLFHRQWEALLEDLTPQVIKIGVLASPELVEATANWIHRFRKRVPGLRVLLDPVAVASTGGVLQQAGCWSAITEQLLPMVDWVLPNLDELKQMIGFQSSDNHSVYDSFQSWLESQANVNGQWLIKGGHAGGSSSCDYWFNPNQDQQRWIGFDSPRQAQTNNRGTGCTLSSAFAAFLAHGYDDADALTLAKAYLNSAMQQAYRVGSGAGPLGVAGWPAHHSQLPTIRMERVLSDERFQHAEAFKPLLPGALTLYPVVNSVDWIARLLPLGIKTIQLRLKDASPEDREQQIQQAVALGNHFEAQVFINDHWELAIKHEAFGVHLGQEDLQVADLAAISKAGLRLGVSTHGYFELAQILPLQPSYIALGHIFPTKTKQMPSQPQGLHRLRRYVELLSGDYPTVAIGGIGHEEIMDVLATGVDSVALVTAITASDQPEQAATQLMSYFNPTYDERTLHG